MSFSHVTHFVHIQVRPDLETDFQTHFSPILDLLSNCLDCEHVEPKWYFDIDLRSIPIDCLEKKENRFESRYVSKYRPGRNCNLLSPTTDWKRSYRAYNSFWKIHSNETISAWSDMNSFWRIDTFEPFFLFWLPIPKAHHVLRFEALTDLNCSTFWRFDEFGVIFGSILSIL